MRFSLSDLEAFVAVAERASFSKAAEQVHVSQPALSRRIGKLEDALSVRLFDRGTRPVDLTTVGRDFATKARTLLDELEQSLLALGEAAASRTGEVTVACVPSAAYYFLPSVIRLFHERFPRIRVRFVDESANTVLSAVARGEADFGINFIGTQDPEVEFRPLMKEPFVAVCRRDHALARRRQLRWAELRAADYVTVSKSSGNRLLLDLALAEARDRPVWFYEARHVSTVLGFVEAGLGVAAVPRLALPAGEHPVLRAIPLIEPRVTRTIGLIKRRGRALSPAAAALYEMVKGEKALAGGRRALSKRSKLSADRSTARLR